MQNGALFTDARMYAKAFLFQLLRVEKLLAQIAAMARRHVREQVYHLAAIVVVEEFARLLECAAMWRRTVPIHDEHPAKSLFPEVAGQVHVHGTKCLEPN